ncbi:hypothetical protein [Nitrosomonas oligotropha]|uniref:hypothetical protein n=1 Tax=Nitrosomonas oligotropha TaxID=42354 RepID=UPI00136D0A42|nr:hypothetical protein [Nitrosomonas oligotropha]MXS82257.1 hypothetical protein [Nitrosomonas oligotropha]
MFAKLFETGVGQILVKKDSGKEGPEVRFYFQPEGLGVCSVALDGFGDDENGWDAVDKAFEQIDAETAVNVVRPAINQFCGIFTNALSEAPK